MKTYLSLKVDPRHRLEFMTSKVRLKCNTSPIYLFFILLCFFSVILNVNNFRKHLEFSIDKVRL